MPEASFIDAIADVLVLDYDTVATHAGYRPATLLDEDPDSPEAQLAAMVRHITWDQDRYELVRGIFTQMLEMDRKRRQAGKEGA